MDAVRQLKRLIPPKTKIGHAGTLDPLAEGVLPICIGTATRLMDYAVSHRKIYRTTLHLGFISDTYDAEGTITAHGETSHITANLISQAILPFIGMIDQIPPMYSALKQNGKRLYELARAGLEVERAPRKVSISQIDVIQYTNPSLELRVICGSGVYIRSLASDIGLSLGCGAYITELIRESSGHFHISDSTTLQKALTLNETLFTSLLKPLDFPLQELPRVNLSNEEHRKLAQGQPVPANLDISIREETTYIRAYNHSDSFIGLIKKYDDTWRPYKIFNIPQKP